MTASLQRGSWLPILQAIKAVMSHRTARSVGPALGVACQKSLPQERKIAPVSPHDHDVALW